MGHWEQVLDDLVRDRGPALVGYATLLTGSTREAEDLVQDALVRAFSRARTPVDPLAAETYVRRSILNTYLDGYRRRARWQGIRHLFVTRPTDQSPEMQIQTRVDVGMALRQLTQRERACVVLRFYEDLTVPSIAERIGISEGAVKRYLSDAVHRLEAVLGPDPRSDAQTEIIDLIKYGSRP